MIYNFNNKYISESKYSKHKTYEVTVIEKQDSSSDKITYLVKLNYGENNKEDKFLLNIYLKNKYKEKPNMTEPEINQCLNYIYGDVLKVQGKIKLPEKLGNIGEFDYLRYLNSKNIYGVINVKSGESLKSSIKYVGNVTDSIFISRIYNLKRSFSNKVDKALGKSEQGLFKSMVYGDKTELDKGIEEDFRNIGISHLIAVSGSNISVILTLYIFVFSRFKFKKSISKWVLNILSIFIIFSYMILASMELSIIRAGVFNILVIILKAFNIKVPSEKVLTVVFLFMFVINPMIIYNVGMILSFLATLGIIVFSKRISNYIESKMYWNIKKKKLRTFLTFLSVPISITLSANIAIFPVVIYYFNSFSPLIIISNVLVSTIDSVIVSIGVMAFLLQKVAFVFKFILSIEKVMLKTLILIAEFLSSLNLEITFKSPNISIISIYYLFLILIYISFKIKGPKGKLIKEKIMKLKKCTLCLLLISILFSMVQDRYFNDYVYFFNVGQGEMSLLKKKNEIILVDAGSTTNNVGTVLENYLRHENITRISYIIVSHFHDDHVNYLYDILEKYPVKGVIFSIMQDEKNEEYIKFVKYMKKSNIASICVKSGDVLKIVNDLNINILAPVNEHFLEYDVKDLNQTSLVFKLKISDINMLFMGDANKKSEEIILKHYVENSSSKTSLLKDIHVLKVGHHGSKDSSSDRYISQIMPLFSVISCKKSEYGHPNSEVIKLLEKYDVRYVVTENIGGIKIRT